MTPLFTRRRTRLPEQRQPHERSRSPEEAARSIEREQAELERIKAETPFFAALGKSLRDLREQNHFRDAFEATFRGSRP